MYSERPLFEQAIIDVASELGYRVEPGVQEHSGRHFKLLYRGIHRTDYIKIDADYLNRSPLLPPVTLQVESSPGTVAFPLNSTPELIGGKLKALLGRVVPRDLFDICNIARAYPDLSPKEDDHL
jgi:predicted nucleotidyltransferase component of viral defense system